MVLKDVLRGEEDGDSRLKNVKWGKKWKKEVLRVVADNFKNISLDRHLDQFSDLIFESFLAILSCELQQIIVAVSADTEWCWLMF